jgi:hypothetical protein
VRTSELNHAKLPLLLRLDYERNRIKALEMRLKQAEDLMKKIQNAPSLERAQNYARVYLEGKREWN